MEHLRAKVSTKTTTATFSLELKASCLRDVESLINLQQHSPPSIRLHNSFSPSCWAFSFPLKISYICSLEGFRKKGEMPTSEETRFQQGYGEQVLQPPSISSQNRTLLVSTPTAMINTANPSHSLHADRSVPEHITNLLPTAVNTISVKIYFNNTGFIY